MLPVTLKSFVANEDTTTPVLRVTSIRDPSSKFAYTNTLPLWPSCFNSWLSLTVVSNDRVDTSLGSLLTLLGGLVTNDPDVTSTTSKVLTRAPTLSSTLTLAVDKTFTDVPSPLTVSSSKPLCTAVMVALLLLICTMSWVPDAVTTSANGVTSISPFNESEFPPTVLITAYRADWWSGWQSVCAIFRSVTEFVKLFAVLRDEPPTVLGLTSTRTVSGYQMRNRTLVTYVSPLI